MPTDNQAILDTIAAAMAEVREPDLSSFDPSQVQTALERVLQSPASRENFLAWLNGRVQMLSGGRASIEERPIAGRPLGGQDSVPELPVRIAVEGEPFAEPAVLRADDRVVHFPMRG